jgi:hypothetical protein
MAKERYECECGKKVWDTAESRASHVEKSPSHAGWLSTQPVAVQAIATEGASTDTERRLAAAQARIAELEAEAAPPKNPEFDWDSYITEFPEIKEGADLLHVASGNPVHRHFGATKAIRRVFSDNFLPRDQWTVSVLDVLRHFKIPIETPARFYPSNDQYMDAELVTSPPLGA